jgi:hypothetical protein
MQRLTFIAKDGAIELLSQQTVDMKLASPKHEANAQHEFWYEVRDARDATLAVHPAPDPIRPDIEVFSNDPSHSASRAPDARAERVFSVVLPDVEAASQVVLMRRARTAPHAGLAKAASPNTAVEVGRVTLKKA